MNFVELQPAPPLRRHVECFWAVSSGGEPAPQSVGRILPDGCVELVMNFAAPVRRHHDDDRTECQPERMVVGQIKRCVRIEHTGRADYLGVRFRSTGARQFLRLPLVELTDRILPLDALSSELENKLKNMIDPAWSAHQRITLLEKILLRHLAAGAPENDDRVEEAVRAIRRTRGLITISTLMTQSGISARQLERRFKHAIGISPKMMCRILRFRRVCRAAEEIDTRRSWADVAAECGYYDQAHLIRDFREFAGESPARLFPEGWNAAGEIKRVES